jgi:hypothetical protein
LQQQETKQQGKTTVEWKKVKEDWLSKIDVLYGDIEAWLQEYIDTGRATISKSSLPMNEEFLGSYEAQKLTILVANSTVALTPIARVIVGGLGRVDMVGSAGRRKIILIDKDIKEVMSALHFNERCRKVEEKIPETAREITPTWKLSTPPPKISLIELTDESFFDALTEVIHG